jgi:hypothetical protein
MEECPAMSADTQTAAKSIYFFATPDPILYKAGMIAKYRKAA